MKILRFVFFFVIGCASLPQSSSYPERWWQDGGEPAKSWEILPSAANRNKNEVILSKRNELGLLSNFAPTPFLYRGKMYASLEGFWQMMKYPEGPRDERALKGSVWPHTRAEVANMAAFDASRAGKEAGEIMKKMKIDWITFEGEKIYYKSRPEGQDRHFQLIYEATVAKIQQNPRVKELLLATGNLQLLPDHHQDADATKAYRYFEIYMGLRDKLRKENVSQ